MTLQKSTDSNGNTESLSEMSSQQTAFAIAWAHAQAGKRVKLSKESGQWHVEIR